MTSDSGVGCAPSSKALVPDFTFVAEPARACYALFLQAWRWLTMHGCGVLTRGGCRRLKIAETVSLGEKRFVSILHVDGEQFLVGGSSSNIVLLAKLEAKPETLSTGSFERVFLRAESADGTNEADYRGPSEVTR